MKINTVVGLSVLIYLLTGCTENTLGNNGDDTAFDTSFQTNAGTTDESQNPASTNSKDGVNSTNNDGNSASADDSDFGGVDNNSGETDKKDQTEAFDTEDANVCDERSISIEPVPGRMMFLVDMSISMLDGDPPKLDQATAAITDVLNDFKGNGVEWGLDLFPDGSTDPSGKTRCGVNNPVVIDTGMNTEDAIVEALNLPHTFGATPIYCAMENYKDANYAPKFNNTKSNNILVVVTDGKDNCYTDCQENTQMASEFEFGRLSSDLCNNYGIRTVVIGFGQETDEGQLNAIAENGCTEYTNYIQADNQEELRDSLAMLAGLAIGCTFSIGELNEKVDPNLVNIYFDDELIMYDTNCASGVGWTWTSDQFTEIEFCEEACKEINSGDVESVSAKFGCKTIVIV